MFYLIKCRIDLQILPSDLGPFFVEGFPRPSSQELLDSACHPQDAAQDTWGRRFEGRGVGVLVEWQNKARTKKDTRNGWDEMADKK